MLWRRRGDLRKGSSSGVSWEGFLAQVRSEGSS
jgi:hypothetical protein